MGCSCRHEAPSCSCSSITSYVSSRVPAGSLLPVARSSWSCSWASRSKFKRTLSQCLVLSSHIKVLPLSQTRLPQSPSPKYWSWSPWSSWTPLHAPTSSSPLFTGSHGSSQPADGSLQLTGRQTVNQNYYFHSDNYVLVSFMLIS